LIRARVEATAAADDDHGDKDTNEADIPRPAVAAQPCPRPRMLHHPANTRDALPVGETCEAADIADDDGKQPTEANLPPPTVAVRPRPRPRMLRRPANTRGAEVVENVAPSENQATEMDKHLPLATGHHPTQPRMVDHLASSNETTVCKDVDEDQQGVGEGAVDDSQCGSRVKLPETDDRGRVEFVETTVNALEGGDLQQDAVGDGDNGNRRTRASRRNPRQQK